MRGSVLLLLCLALVAVSGCRIDLGEALPEPPVAKIVPHELEQHGDVRVDSYYWLNQRDDPEVISYLKAENEYTDAMMQHTASLQTKLVEEFTERIKQTDESVPYRRGNYFYYRRTEGGKDYPIYARKQGSLTAAEEVILDVNELAKGQAGYFQAGGLKVTDDHRTLAYAVDTQGRRIYTARFKDLTTGETLPDSISDVVPNFAWANDHKTVFYVRKDPVTLRAYQIWRHRLGTDAKNDVLIHDETDETFSCGVGKTKSRQYILIDCEQTLASEFSCLDADRPDDKFKMFLPRKRGHEYDIDHFGSDFYIRTNDRAKNFRLMKTAVTKTARRNWTEVIPARDDVYLAGIEIFKNYLVVVERKAGLLELRIRPWDGGSEHYVDFGEPAYSAFPQDNYDFDTTTLRYRYESLTTPDSVFDYDMRTQAKTLLKEDEVLGGFDKKNYVAERIYARARDGVSVPISLVYRKGLEKNGSHPLLLTGYGSYGFSRDANFNPFRISLLDRGMIYAIAHIRGGQEMGRSWYENGKLLKKKNTFTDFIDCARHLVAEHYTEPEKTVAVGASAGGLLIGAVVNMAPQDFVAVHAAVPFVDVVTTMLDDSIPLTTGEFDEWGDPKIKQYYDYMKSYSPYDNVSAQSYPAMLVTTGLHDSQVQYFEPAKWVAKLRALKTDDHLLLLKTEMEAGHGGAAARTKRYRQRAFEYAFLLDQVGITR